VKATEPALILFYFVETIFKALIQKHNLELTLAGEGLEWLPW